MVGCSFQPASSKSNHILHRDAMGSNQLASSVAAQRKPIAVNTTTGRARQGRRSYAKTLLAWNRGFANSRTQIIRQLPSLCTTHIRISIRVHHPLLLQARREVIHSLFHILHFFQVCCCYTVAQIVTLTAFADSPQDCWTQLPVSSNQKKKPSFMNSIFRF